MAGPGAAGEGAGLSGFALLPWPPLPLAADCHFLFLGPHGGAGLPTAAAFSCLHVQTPGTGWLLLSVALPKSRGRVLIGLFGPGAHPWANGLCQGQAPSANLQPSGGHRALGGQVWEAQGAIPQ